MLLIELFYCDVLQIFGENIFLFWCSRAVFVWHATFVIFRNTRQSVIDSAVLLCPCECERDFHLCSTRVKNNTLRAISRVNVKVNPWFRFYLKMHTHFTLGLECVCVCVCVATGDNQRSGESVILSDAINDFEIFPMYSFNHDNKSNKKSEIFDNEIYIFDLI